jgi:hypothetical protein
MTTRQTICAIEGAAANSMALAGPDAVLILGSLLLLIRP